MRLIWGYYKVYISEVLSNSSISATFNLLRNIKYNLCIYFSNMQALIYMNKLLTFFLNKSIAEMVACTVLVEWTVLCSLVYLAIGEYHQSCLIEIKPQYHSTARIFQKGHQVHHSTQYQTGISLK